MESKSALLVGVGGQGAILTAKVLVAGLMQAGYDVKMSEVHGMSQRGGSVSTQVLSLIHISPGKAPSDTPGRRQDTGPGPFSAGK